MKRALAAGGALAAAIALTSGSAASVASDEPILGPEGYKTLELGQSEQEAEATGLLVDRQQPEECILYRLRPEEGKPNPGGGVFVDPQLGVVMIGGTDKIHTPEGIGFGDPLDQVRANYPDLEPVPENDFVYTAGVPGHDGLEYRFAVDEADLVSDFSLEGPDGGSCFS